MSTDWDAVPDAILGDAIRALDIAFIEWLPDGSYVPLAMTPRWFTGVTPWSSLPFLEHFVSEAKRYLHEHVDGVLASDQFTVQSHAEELLLRARALKINRRLVLAIERLEGATDLRPMLREARQQALDHEAAADQARKIHGPIDALTKAVAELQRAGIAETQQPAVEAVTRALSALQQAAAALPAARRRR